MKKLNLILFLIITVAALSAFKCGDGNAPKAPKLTVSCETEQKSNPTNGASVCSKSGVSQAHLNAIDEELKQLSDDVAARNYSQGRFPSSYVIFIYDQCVLSPESRTRSFLVDGGTAYDGTEFDYWNPRGKFVKDGESRVYAAELVIQSGYGHLTNGYIVCNTPTIDATFRNATRYGAEHIILYLNDRAEFDRTWFHGSGISHPIIPTTNTKLTESALPADVVDWVTEVKIKGNIKLKNQ